MQFDEEHERGEYMERSMHTRLVTHPGLLPLSLRGIRDREREREKNREKMRRIINRVVVPSTTEFFGHLLC